MEDIMDQRSDRAKKQSNLAHAEWCEKLDQVDLENIATIREEEKSEDSVIVKPNVLPQHL